MVSEDHALEAHELLQISAEHVHVAAGPHAIYLTGIAHDPGSARVHCSLEWRVEDVPSSDVGSDVVVMNRHLLHFTQKLRYCDDPPAVDGQAPHPGQNATQNGVLTGQGVKVLVVLRRPMDVDSWPKHHVGAQGLELLCDGYSNLLDQIRVPRGRKCQIRREGSHPLCLFGSLRLPSRDCTRHLEGRDTEVRQWDSLAFIGT
mmetsp:Transcript_105362/g.280543  ORF Transcript_105362/g.280543 Transcript_105362/m.280543 type:complete len:202 (-) Transcript_105362:309-914(-)